MKPHPGNLLLLSSEVIEQALIHCHPRDVAAFSQTCRRARHLIYHGTDQYLWRELFLTYPFDDPRQTHQGLRRDILFDWKTELQRRIHAEVIARSPRTSAAEEREALETLLSVVCTASPITLGCERVSSPSLLWVVEVLQSRNMLQSPTFNHPDMSQDLARLRSYLALTLDDYEEDDLQGRERLKTLRTRSRCYVYSLRNYYKNNDWGPLTRSGDVNWVHMESIINVILSNQAELPQRLVDTRPPCGLEATRAYSAPGATTRDPRDWAGIEGHWRRYVSFMDYRDLYAFNAGAQSDTDSGTFFERTSFGEATILVHLRLLLIEPDAVPKYYTLDRFPDADDPVHPTLYFTGSSVGIDGNEAGVIGSVFMSKNGVVRWRFASVHDHKLRWCSEGVQLGGIASAAGVVGTWTGAYHEHGDPVGPFWLWKIEEDPNNQRLLVTLQF